MGKISEKIKIFLGFAVIYTVWGTTYLAIRFALESIPPFMMAGSRFVIAGLILFSWSYSRYSFKPKIADLKLPVIAGLFMILVGHGSVAWAEQHISSGFAAVEAASIPVWIVLLSWIQSPANKPGRLTITGIILGMAGVVMLVVSGGDFSIDHSVSNASIIFSVVFLITGTISWSIGTIQSRKINKSLPLLYTISIQMLTGGVALTLVSLIKGEASELSLSSLSTLSLLSLAHLIIFGSLIAYSSYVWLMNKCSPAKVSTYAFVNPLIAVLLGWLIAGEPITSIMVVGAAAILISVLLINRVFSLRKRKKVFNASGQIIEPEEKILCSEKAI